MLDQLKAKAKWLRGLDSGSGDAEQIEWAVSQIERQMAEMDKLRKALDLCLIGGNHLATYRTDKWPEPDADPQDALRILCATPEYDMWCCWAAIMRARRAIQ